MSHSQFTPQKKQDQETKKQPLPSPRTPLVRKASQLPFTSPSTPVVGMAALALSTPAPVKSASMSSSAEALARFSLPASAAAVKTDADSASQSQAVPATPALSRKRKFDLLQAPRRPSGKARTGQSTEVKTPKAKAQRDEFLTRAPQKKRPKATPETDRGAPIDLSSVAPLSVMFSPAEKNPASQAQVSQSPASPAVVKTPIAMPASPRTPSPHKR